MAEIRMDAAYVRHETLSQLDARQVLQSLQHRAGTELPDAMLDIWKLLETPQTVQSIARTLANRSPLQAGMVQDVLSQLFEADLIQLSPDS